VLKAIYYVGEDISLKTKVEDGRLLLGDDSIQILGKENLTIQYSKINSIEGVRLHGLGQMIKLDFDGKIIYFSIIRINLFGYFVIINLFETLKVLKNIKLKKLKS
jgi:hypothetical protein